MNSTARSCEWLAFSIRFQLPANIWFSIDDLARGWWTRNDSYLYFDDRLWSAWQPSVVQVQLATIVAPVPRLSSSKY